VSAQERIAATLEGLLAIQTRRERRERAERDECERQRIGSRSEPQRITFALALRSIPGLAAEFRRAIPADFWSLDGKRAIVACPCGEEEPAVELGATATCKCERAYLYTGDTVRVAFSPSNRPTPVQS
jgi:hypothetical protein